MTKYKFKGYTITNCGYHQPDHCVWWEAVNENGEACFHGNTLREVEFEILDYEWEQKIRRKDEEIERLKTMPVGNAAALREALESFMVGSCVYPCVESCGYDPIDEICMRCAASPEKDGDCPYEKARKALAAPPRNCDAMPWRKAWDEWRAKHHPQNPQTFNESYEATVAFMEWFTAPASEKGADDGE